MRATLMHSALDVRIEHVADPVIEKPTDALIRIARACICGSDLWPYNGGPNVIGQHMGHEAIGVVLEVGREVQTIRPGQVVIMPFAYSDGSCLFCADGLQTACRHGGFFGVGGEIGGAQAEALRVPLADGTLFAMDVGEDDALMASLLTLSDVMGTGHHAAVVARVRRGGSVAVIGDGAVGLCGVIAARRLGAERIVMLGRHQDRLDLARRFGATDFVRERGEEGVERVRALTGGLGVQSVLECVGTAEAMVTAMGLVRAGGAVGRVGVPHYEVIPDAQPMFYQNVIVGGGPAPVRSYIETLLPDIREGLIEPGLVFDRTVDLDGVPDGYAAMNNREALKVMIRP